MPEEMIMLAALVIAGLITRVFYKNVMSGNTKKQRFVDRAKHCGCVTKGTVVKTKMMFGDSSSDDPRVSEERMLVVYNYMVDGTTYEKAVVFQEPGSVRVKYPNEIVIYYDRSNPKKNVASVDVTAEKRRESGCLSSLVVFIICLFFVFRLLRFLLLRG